MNANETAVVVFVKHVSMIPDGLIVIVASAGMMVAQRRT